MLSISQPLNTLFKEFRSRLPLLKDFVSVGNEQLKAAFDLAYFIQPDQQIASSIVSSALSQIDVAFSVQYKRKYYSPTGRSNTSSKQKLRNKVLMSRLQLLQCLVYARSEPFEVAQERDREAGLLDEEDMIIRFIKHLVRVSVRRNSFYVTVGISRLLHSFNTAETMHIYSLVVQDPDRVKDDQYYRSRKRELMREIVSRFGSLVKEVRGARGETRLEADDKSGERIGIVQRALEMFTPWGTRCVIPEKFDPDFDELPELAFNGEKADEEHPIEMKRMHSIIDPLCFSRITSALRYDSPEQRLTLPRFNIAKGGDQGMNTRGDRFNPPELNDEQVSAIWKEVTEQKARRKKASPKALKVRVDWKEVGRLESGKESRVKFKVDKWAEFIRVYAEDEKGEFVVAIYLLDYSGEMEEGEIEECTVELEGGGRIIFEVKMRTDRYGEYKGAEVEVGYEEKSAVEAAREYLREVGYGRGPFIRRTKERNESSNGIMNRRFAFGEMNAGSIADNPFFSKQVLADPMRTSLARFYQHLSLGIITKQALFDYGRRLVSLAEEARFLRQQDVLDEISDRLTTLPLRQFQNVGSYYRAFCLKWRGQAEEARTLFENVSEKGPISYRAKAIQSLGTTYLDKGDFATAHKLLIEASRLSSLDEFASPIAFLQSQWWLGILQSLDGDHKSSLIRLEGLRPLVEVVASRHTSLWFEYQNSRAVELMEVGRLEEAQRASRIAIASPFARVYPEWHETARDIATRTRRASPSVVSLSIPRSESKPIQPQQPAARPAKVSDKVVRLHTETRSKPSDPPAQTTARILAFPDREKKID